MKLETLKTLIREAAGRETDVESFLDEVLSLIDLYDDDQDQRAVFTPPPMPLPNRGLADFRDYLPVKGDPGLVPFHTICGCNPANGGSGICGCVIANKMVDPTSGSNFGPTVTWPNTNSTVG
jgi:hypothetical protein